MVKLTAELIQQSPQYINPVRDRELNLRGYKIPVIENLGATLDQFDCFDLSDNDIRKLDGFPFLKRLKTIIMCNNRVCRIAENLEQSLPNLESLILTNNHMQELGDLDNLATVKHLRCLSLLKNPVSHKKHYRLYVIHKLPQVLLLDFQKVRMKEREAALKMFKGKKGKQLEREISKRTRTFVPGAAMEGIPEASDKPAGPSATDVEAIKNAIKNASSLEEIEHLKSLLKSGQIPGKVAKSSKSKASEVEVEEEEMETEVSNGN